MVEYKFTAKKLNGQSISGTLTADSSSEGKKKIQRLAEKNQLKLLLKKNQLFFIKHKKGLINLFVVNKKLLIKKKLKML